MSNLVFILCPNLGIIFLKIMVPGTLKCQLQDKRASFFLDLDFMELRVPELVL